MDSILVTGATGFVGQALLLELIAAGHKVRAATRNLTHANPELNVDWVRCDVTERADVERALRGVDTAYFLIHAMGGGQHDFAQLERRAAHLFAEVAAQAGVKRIIYLGGVAPTENPSQHLKSRLEVGEILRAGSVPTLELRASMIIGNGSASWQILRDLALRLPAMLLPAWTESRTRPIAIEDVTIALVRALDVPLPASTWYDLPGPEVLSARELLLRVAALRGRRVPSLRVPFLSVSLSSWWLKLVTRADFSLARELVLGFSGDLLPRDGRYWDEINYRPKWKFGAAAQHTLDHEKREPTLRGVVAKLEESVVQLVGPKLSSAEPSPVPPGLQR